MAVSYKCFGVTDDGIKKVLFNGKTLKNKTELVSCLDNASMTRNFLPYIKIIVEKTQTFASGSKAALWPNGQTSQTFFDVVDGCIDIEKVKSAFVKRETKKSSNKTVRYFYSEKYSVGRDPVTKALPKNIDAEQFVAQLKNIDFKNLNCIIILKTVVNNDTRNSTYIERMLYNPAFMYNSYTMIIGSVYAKPVQTRDIQENDLPFTKTILNNWIENPETISKKLIRFFNHNAR